MPDCRRACLPAAEFESGVRGVGIPRCHSNSIPVKLGCRPCRGRISKSLLHARGARALMRGFAADSRLARGVCALAFATLSDSTPQKVADVFTGTLCEDRHECFQTAGRAGHVHGQKSGTSGNPGCICCTSRPQCGLQREGFSQCPLPLTFLTSVASFWRCMGVVSVVHKSRLR